MGLGDVVNEFLNQHSLSDTGTSEETNLSTTSVGSEEIDDLDTCFQHLGGGGLVDERRRLGVNGGELDTLDGTTLVNGLTNDVHDTAEGSGSDRDHDRSASVNDLGAANETLGTVHSNGADRVLTQMGRDLEDKTTTGEVLDLKSIEDRWEVVGIELNVHNGTNDGFHRANCAFCLGRIRASCGCRNVRKDSRNAVDYSLETEGDAGETRGRAERCWVLAGSAERWRAVADEKNALVCFTLLKDLFERRATAPLVVSMVDRGKGLVVERNENRQNCLQIPTRRIIFHTLPASSAFVRTQP